MNQVFKLLPDGKVTKYLTYKLMKARIEVKLVENSYTSVTDFGNKIVEVIRTRKGKGNKDRTGFVSYQKVYQCKVSMQR